MSNVTFLYCAFCIIDRALTILARHKPFGTKPDWMQIVLTFMWGRMSSLWWGCLLNIELKWQKSYNTFRAFWPMFSVKSLTFSAVLFIILKIALKVINENLDNSYLTSVWSWVLVNWDRQVNIEIMIHGKVPRPERKLIF